MTLFTLSNDYKKSKRTFFIYIGVVIFCIAFGIIYEIFSHGIISLFTLLGFLIPLFLGLIPYCLFTFCFKTSAPNTISSYLYNAGVATLTVGSYYIGMLEIYGTTRDRYVYIYLITSIVLLTFGIASYVISIIKSKINKNVQ